MRLVADSPAVAHIEESWPEFARDPRHVRLGLASDGVSPYSIKSSTYSTWPVALMNYNIPPWLATKKGFIKLALIIPGPKQTTNFDVFLQPLVEELSQLWQGVSDVFDGRTHRIGRDRWFTLRGIMMWTMHDYPGYGIISGFQTKGYCACPTCAVDLPYSWLYQLRKVVYMEFSTFLPLDHPFRGVGEDRNLDPPPVARTMDWWENTWMDVQGGRRQQDESGLRRWSILHQLPYWKHLQIHHLLDPMHIEAKVVKSLIKHLFGEKDNVRSRRACEEFNVHPDTWMQINEDGSETMPSAPWVLRKEERKVLCQRISKIRFPTGFGSYLRKTFKTDKRTWPTSRSSLRPLEIDEMGPL
ncbi:hypothetical protein R1sor_026510 [Riccia sorocarpa]|uniref:Transposase n=1 Tax=Riccia sorocarpa TaxID=122646 RepID=A0ABD3GBK6_9MARC